MITLKVIGIGPGGHDQLTLAAVRALGEVKTFLVTDKGEASSELVDFRAELLAMHAPAAATVLITDPPRDRSAEKPGGTDAAYHQAVEDWHDARAAKWAETLLAAEGPCGVLVWGDPAYYDSTLRIVERIQAMGHDVDLEVIPGISAPQMLAAAHGIALNRVGSPIHITTGRRLVAEYSPSLGDVVVMLDGRLQCQELRGHDLEIFWGAYLGSPDQVLRRGPLAEVIDEIVALRADLRAQHGWVMDTYLLRPLP